MDVNGTKTKGFGTILPNVGWALAPFRDSH